MSNIVITDSNQFKNVIDHFNNIVDNIEKTFVNENTNFKRIENKTFWDSDLQEEINNKYEELSKLYPGIINSLNELSKTMQKTLDEYIKFENTTNNSIETNIDNLDVN